MQTLGKASFAADTVTGLPQAGNGTVVTDEESAPRFPIISVLTALGRTVLIDALVVVKEYRGDIHAIRTRHTVSAVGTGNVRAVHHPLRRVVKETPLLGG